MTEENRAGEILKKLRQENAFVYYDEAKGVYRIHPVLLDFLRARQTDRAEVSLLYRRVGEWFLGKEAFKPAYTYLCRAGETERVLSLLDEEDAITKDSSEFEGAPEMFAAAPRKLLLRYPFAYLQYIPRVAASKRRPRHRSGRRIPPGRTGGVLRAAYGTSPKPPQPCPRGNLCSARFRRVQ